MLWRAVSESGGLERMPTLLSLASAATGREEFLRYIPRFAPPLHRSSTRDWTYYNCFALNSLSNFARSFHSRRDKTVLNRYLSHIFALHISSSWKTVFCTIGIIQAALIGPNIRNCSFQAVS